MTLSAFIALAAALIVTSNGYGQSQAKAGDRYKSLQLLRDIPSSQLGPIMLSWNQALGVTCRHCHSGSSYAAENPVKDRARAMQRMLEAVNSTTFARADLPKVTCYSCHRGRPQPANDSRSEQPE